MKQCHEHGGAPVNTFDSILKRYIVHTAPKILFAGGTELLGLAQCHIHASWLEDLVYQFDITSGTDGRQCDNTHTFVIDDRLLKTICGPTHRPLSLPGLRFHS